MNDVGEEGQYRLARPAAFVENDRLGVRYDKGGDDQEKCAQPNLVGLRDYRSGRRFH